MSECSLTPSWQSLLRGRGWPSSLLDIQRWDRGDRAKLGSLQRLRSAPRQSPRARRNRQRTRAPPRDREIRAFLGWDSVLILCIYSYVVWLFNGGECREERGTGWGEVYRRAGSGLNRGCVMSQRQRAGESRPARIAEEDRQKRTLLVFF